MKNAISFERGPQSERGPGSARASRALNWSFVRARARTQDPIHPEDLFQGKLCWNQQWWKNWTADEAHFRPKFFPPTRPWPQLPQPVIDSCQLGNGWAPSALLRRRIGSQSGTWAWRKSSPDIKFTSMVPRVSAYNIAIQGISIWCLPSLICRVSTYDFCHPWRPEYIQIIRYYMYLSIRTPILWPRSRCPSLCWFL